MVHIDGSLVAGTPVLDPDDENSPSDLKLQYNTVRGYISAIQKLYEEQKSRNINPAVQLQGVALKALKKSILASVWSSKRKEFVDRGTGTLKDIYTPSQVPQHIAAAWVGLGDGKKPNYGCMLCTNVDFLLGNHMLLRSSNRRPLELPDCFRLELPNEGVRGSTLAPAPKTYAFVVVMNKGKTN